MSKLTDKRIFIVEDNSTNQIVMQILLEQQRAKIGFERWGVDTIKKLQAFAPVDIILLDLTFPDDITGYDIFDQIRELNEFDTIPIVAVSATDPFEAIPRTHNKGFAGFISKPIKPALFVNQVADILNGKEVWHSG